MIDASRHQNSPSHPLLGGRHVLSDLPDQPHLSRPHLKGTVKLSGPPPLRQVDPRLAEVGMDGVEHKSHPRVLCVVGVVEAAAAQTTIAASHTSRVPPTNLPPAGVMGLLFLVGQLDAVAGHRVFVGCGMWPLFYCLCRLCQEGISLLPDNGSRGHVG